MCVFDYNGDGLMDLYFVTGTWTNNVSSNEGRDLRGKLSNKLYRNNGDGTFTDVTEQAGVGGNGVFSSGCSAADYDNDGHVDLYVLNYGRNILYHNNGDGTFTDVSKKSGLADPRWSLSAVWFDYNHDGYLDVFVANYILYDDGKFRDFYPAAGYPGPLSYSPQPSALYRNNGDGTFTDVTKEAGVFKQGRAMSVTAADFRNAGLLDIFVTNDAMENHYFENTGKGTFVEKALEYGVAYGENGQGVSSMGPVVGDFNRDGLLDIFIPNLNYCILYTQTLDQKGRRNFVDQTAITRTVPGHGQYAGWGAVAFDYDNDGWLDLFTTHGDAHHEYVQENTLMRNNGNGQIRGRLRPLGPAFQGEVRRTRSRLGGFRQRRRHRPGDVEPERSPDSASQRRRQPANNWLTVDAKLKFPTGSSRGHRRPRHGHGRVAETDRGRDSDARLPVARRSARALRARKGPECRLVEIRWPDGAVEKMEHVKANQFLKLTHDAKANGVKR